MSNSPLAPERIGRRNVFLPIDQPVEVVPGSRIRVRLHIIPDDLILTWKVAISRPVGGRGEFSAEKSFMHSTMRGMLMTRENLQQTRPEFVPRLTPWGEARRTILELVDGQRPLGEIEQQLLRRHPELFPSLKEAAVFVAEVVTRYSV
jgi:hypothetical protein